MHFGRFIFAQLLDLLSRYEFNKCVSRYDGNRRIRSFSCWDQFLVMLFAQLTYRDSLRDIESCLRAFLRQLYHIGIRGAICRSTLADANEHRSWRIWADFALVLIARARHLYAGEPVAGRLKAATYVFDTTTIDLCLTLFPWAQFRRRKSAVKLHTLLDLRGNIPCFINVSAGSVHEVNVLDDLILEAGAYYIMDRGFVDFARLHRITLEQAFFVIRAKDNLDYRVIESRAVDHARGLRADQTIKLRGPLSRKRHPAPLRRVSFIDRESGQTLVFLTNNFTLAASTIARLYKARWQVELFFKWIKQYLRIKTFFGTSPNAVKTQVWIAVSAYVLVAIAKRELELAPPMGEILQVLSLMLFEKTPIFQVFLQEA
ncbi:MAG TPA: IS4 family transposase, partial [Tepidisphaeraceae bacterium]|nr:IS4 family transposase [Tepidisphaeraceae bacterium]